MRVAEARIMSIRGALRPPSDAHDACLWMGPGVQQKLPRVGRLRSPHLTQPVNFSK